VSTVASPNSAHAHGPHAAQARQNPAPQAAAPQTPFSALIDATASDPAPLPPPAAKPAPPHGKDAKDTKDATKDSGPANQGGANPPAAAARGSADDTPPASVATAVADAQDATKDTASKDDVATSAPDPASEAAPDPAAKQDGTSDAVAAVVAPVTVAPPVVAVPVVPVVPVATTPDVGPAPSETAPAVAAIAATTATAANAAAAPAAAAQVVADADTAGALGVATAGQGTPGQKPGKPLAAETAPKDSALATDAGEPTDPKAAAPKTPTPGPLVAANAATAHPDADDVNGAEPHPAAHAGKAATTDKESAGARDSLRAAAADQLAASTDAPPQAGQATPAADQSAPVVAQTVASTAAAAATNAANAPVAQSAQATAMAVPLAGVAVEIAARATAGSNRFEIRLDPPDLGRIDVRLNVDKQGNVTSHLVVERSATLDLLRRDAPQLERALQDAGLKTGNDGLQFSLRDQGAGAQNQNFQDNGAAARSARVIIPTDDVPPVDTARNYGRLYGLSGGLDIRV
jgi:chemotaxis protein MotD